MNKWYETHAANIGLRTGGIALLTIGWSVALRLHHIALSMSARDATSFMMLLAAIAFICGSAGSALLFVGPGLWETVEVSERWRRLPPPDGGALPAVPTPRRVKGINGYDAGGNSVTFNPGGSAAMLHNVAAGVAPTDAVNVQQLNDGLASTLASANAYTESRLEGIEFDLSSARRDSFAGTAGALAAAGLPQAFESGRGMLAFGAGTYRGESAFALGLSRVLDDGRTVIKAGATYDTQQRAGANVGVGFQF